MNAIRRERLCVYLAPAIGATLSLYGPWRTRGNRPKKPREVISDREAELRYRVGWLLQLDLVPYLETRYVSRMCGSERDPIPDFLDRAVSALPATAQRCRHNGNLIQARKCPERLSSLDTRNLKPVYSPSRGVNRMSSG